MIASLSFVNTICLWKPHTFQWQNLKKGTQWLPLQKSTFLCDNWAKSDGVFTGTPPVIFQGVRSTPCKIFAMLFYINNDDRLCFFYAACIFNLFHSFFVRYFSPQIRISNSPNSIYASGKGSTKLNNTSEQSGIWAMSCGPVPNCEIWAGR